MRRYRWRWPEAQPEVWARLERECGLHPVVARVLAARGITTPEGVGRALASLPPDETDPFLLKDMEAAARRLLHAVEHGEPTVVYGDYDVDGQTATALLVAFLRRLGAPVTYYVPRRLEEGYGLHASALRELHQERRPRLVVTVDCGVTAHEAAEVAAGLGIDLVITDHHLTPQVLPAACAVVNPRRPDCPYPYKGLAGVGVAYKLALATWILAGRPPEADPDQFLDLVALGTVADVMPLVEENRFLVQQGLALLNGGPRPGLAALIRAADMKGPVDSGHLGFILAPRLNAGGRLHDPVAGVQLLLTTSEVEAEGLASHLDQLNRVRQSLEAFVTEQAHRQVEAAGGAEEAAALVVAGEGWHPGVLGLVASRLVEAYYRPTLVVGIEGGLARGSGRSVAGFDLYSALDACRDLLQAFGGHAMAAGFSLDPGQVPGLRARFAEVARERLAPALAAGELLPEVAIDAEVDVASLDENLVAQLEALGPFGPGNPAPVLGHRRLRLVEGRAVGGGGQHWQVRLEEPATGRSVRGIGFRMGEWGAAFPPGAWVQVAFTPMVDEWQGQRETRMRLRAVDAAAGGAGVRVAVAPGSQAGEVLAGEILSGEARSGEAAGAGRAGAVGSGAGPAGTGGAGARRFAGLDLEVLDRREGTPAYVREEARRALLAEELEGYGGRAVLIVADGKAQAAALQVWPQGEGRVVPCTEAPPAEAWEGWMEGEGALQLVIACLPPHPGFLEGWLAGAGEVPRKLRLHLLFGEADRRKMAAVLRTVYPPREDLVRCYRMWQRVMAGEGASAGIPLPTRRAAFRVFREMGLLKQQGGEWVLVPPEKGERLDLRSSPYYARGEALREAFVRWAPYALRAGAQDVAAALLRPFEEAPSPLVQAAAASG